MVTALTLPTPTFAEALANHFNIHELQPRIEKTWSSGSDSTDIEKEFPSVLPEFE